MKKTLSILALLVLASYARPAAAELKFGGDASIRLRGQFQDKGADNNEDDLLFQYRVRLNASADLGSGYVFKAVIGNEAPNLKSDGTVAPGGGGGWQTVGSANTERYTLGVYQFYFGRNLEESHYYAGRLPLNSTNNPVFDLALYPSQPLDLPVNTLNNDRLFGFTYGRKIGPGELNAVVGVFDNDSKDDKAGEGDGLFNDGYVLSLAYKTALGSVTVEPQIFTALTNHSVFNQDLSAFAGSITPVTFGANVSVPAGKAKIGVSAFYTSADDTTPGSGESVDYSGYLFRLKAESGPFLAWYDYNRTTDRSGTADVDYTNQFVWAQYKIKLYEAASGRFSLTPTLRYLASKKDNGTVETDTSRLRTELYATVTF